MKNFLAVTTATILMLAAAPLRAQDSQQPQPPPDQQDVQDQSLGYPQDQDSTDAPNVQDQQASYPQRPGDSQTTPKAQPGVARVSLVHGDVSTQHGDNGEWTSVTLNTPVSQDDRVSTGDKSRAEVQLDWADILRLSDRATARIASLSRTQIQLQLGQGLATYNVLKGSEARSEIDTPNAAIRPEEGEGQFRILVNSDAETQVIVRKGAADIVTSQGSTRVGKGQMITIAGTDSPQYKVARAIDEDRWDDWNNDRNKLIRNATSWGKTNRYYTGSEDLDAYGRWSEIPDYGHVWVPSQDPGWAPYRSGRWVWNPYYGWTWVSYEPWGWAPYHYGRWFVYGGSWAWWPGPVVAYPAYYPLWAPAYVSFFGWGHGGWGVGVGFGLGFGRVGWLPVGPCDWYHPWWGRGGGRVNVVNVTNIHNTTVINNGFRPLAPTHFRQFSNVNGALSNERIRSGMSSMDGNKFGREAVPSHQQKIDGATFKQASMMTGKMPVAPSRESFRATDKAPGASSIRSAPSSSQRFFSPNAKNSTLMASNNQNRASGTGTTATGSRGFAPPQRSLQSGNAQTPTAQPPAHNNSTPKAVKPPAQQQSGRNAPGGWQHFSPPPSHNSQPAGPAPSSRQYQAPSGNSRGGNLNANGRPPLTMNRPIVRPRGGYPTAPRGGYPNPPRGGYYGGANRGPQGAPPSSNAPGGGYYGGAGRSAPSAPPSGGAPSRNSGGASRGNSGGASRGNSGGSSHGSSSSGASHGGGSAPQGGSTSHGGSGRSR
jgi:hypothetical protein